MIEILFKLLIGHAVADYWAQSDGMRVAKAKDGNVRSGGVPVWPYVLTAHALIHGGAVWLITGNVWLGAAETICHWVIDFGKGRHCYGVHADQGLHIACKIAWSVLA
jgi:hypothetical protein